jgi:hypothetical protein
VEEEAKKKRTRKVKRALMRKKKDKKEPTVVIEFTAQDPGLDIWYGCFYLVDFDECLQFL